MIKKQVLINLYFNNNLSMAEIAQKLKVSHSHVVHWMTKNNLGRRTRSEATYVKANPHGDPFCIKRNLNREEIFLKGQRAWTLLG